MKEMSSVVEEYTDNSVMLIATRERKKIQQKRMYMFFKRGIDVCAGIVGSIFAIPIWGIIKISYMLNKDFAPVIFKQKRIGKDGKEFSLYKFRSMVVNADDVLREMLKEDKELAKEYRIYKKMHNDPRITKCGKFLGKTSLDEMPQFFNVLRNDMSLIGNRPYLVREKEDMGEYVKDILETKPGLTGMWQVSGRSETTFEERLEIESKYSNIISFKTDMQILFQTIKVVILKKGAK